MTENVQIGKQKQLIGSEIVAQLVPIILLTKTLHNVTQMLEGPNL